jgi:hypothetical protein
VKLSAKVILNNAGADYDIAKKDLPIGAGYDRHCAANADNKTELDIGKAASTVGCNYR